MNNKEGCQIMTGSPGYMTPRRISVLISSATPEQLREGQDASIE